MSVSSRELVVFRHAETGVIDQQTGEVHDIRSAPVSLLAQVAAELRDRERRGREAKSAIDGEIQSRLREAGERSLLVGGISVEAKETRKWDAKETEAALHVLVADGLVTRQEAAQALPAPATPKPNGTKLNALLLRLIGDDLERAKPLADARKSVQSLKVERAAIDGEVVE